MASAELFQLQEQEIPEAMHQLQDSHTNLKKVADYCEGYYIQASDNEKRPALEETRKYTTQSLASVAYQINTLATSFLSLLDLQTNQLSEMESSINHLAQTVAIHKEKVARREIGVLTTNKSFYRPVGVKTPGIIFPEQTEKPLKYTRKPIDYTILDSVGHGGVKTSVRPAQRAGSVSGMSVHSNSSSTGSKHTNGPSSVAGVGTMSRGGVPRAAPGPVAPPSVPSHYMTAGDLMRAQHPLSNNTSIANALYGSSGASGMGVPPPPPIINDNNRASGYNGDIVLPPPLSPPLPPMPGSQEDAPRHRYTANNSQQYSYYIPDTMPPPPPPESPDPYIPDIHPGYNPRFSGRSSQRSSSPPPPPPTQHVLEDPVWAPENYIEKVVAIYDYDPQNEDELRFREGAVIYVINKNSDGWWEGVMESDYADASARGLFPENYVESLL